MRIFKLIKSKKTRDLLSGILSDGHDDWTLENVTEICDAIDAPVPVHLVKSRKTILVECEVHGDNVGNAEEIGIKNEGDFYRKLGDGKLMLCCPKGQYLGKYIYWISDTKTGEWLFNTEIKRIYSYSFNVWLANTHLKLDFHSTSLGRGSGSREYGNKIKEWLIDHEYVGKDFYVQTP